MPFDTLISAQALAGLMAGQHPPLVVDCGFDLMDTQAGLLAYRRAHLPGAHYLHLEEDLSGAVTGRNGRHPLPHREAFAARMAALGADDDTQIVAYDNAGGMYAARLWWLMRWIGHRAVAVLDGGAAAWTAAGYAMTGDPAAVARPGRLTAREPLARTVSHQDVRDNLATRKRLVVDARAPDRFRGENETIDPVGGHIPGARNRLFRENLDSLGQFRSPEALRAGFQALLAGYPPEQLISQCGSGVTACHNLLALEIAGLPGAALYPGSWSEWCAQAGAPVATGAAD
ncbi:sulfurtransferase [Bordetella bronchialis]|uniref:Sulfurtransferase n=1 Tax=Bordetella bronchialis TaxID=463025 RepID=A0A193FT41_9BORD|nr:sulfurtransferase [Bordetella bronchialis]ANN70229.1 3-mercaptopyruvate sulfurtransferase [Bordetella bronchialis]